MKTAKTIICTVLAAVLCLSAAGCGKAGGNSGPYLLRQDYYRVMYQDADRQEYGILSQNGLKVQKSSTGQPEWISVSLQYETSLDGRVQTIFYDTEDIASSLGVYGTSFARLSDGGAKVNMAEHRARNYGFTALSLDGSAIVYCSGKSGQESQIGWYLERDGKTESLTKILRFNSVFSPDGKSVMYTEWGTDDYTITCILPNGERWSWKESDCLGIGLSNGGEYVYLLKEGNPGKLYVQQKNDPATRVLLGDTLGYLSNTVITSLVKTRFTDRRGNFGYLTYYGPLFDLAMDQTVFCQMEDGCTYYSEKGRPAQRLFDQPAAPVMPESIAIKSMGANISSGAGCMGAQLYTFGLSRLNRMVYQTAENNYRCNLFWVDENWNITLLDNGVESRTIHISEDGRLLHYAKGGSLYCIDLSRNDFPKQLLATGLGGQTEGSYFLVSYNGENVIWADQKGSLFTADRKGGGTGILAGTDVDFDYDICAAGDAGFVCRADKKLYYVESGAKEITGLQGQFSKDIIFYDCEGVYLYAISEENDLLHYYITTDGQNFKLVYTEEK